MIPIVVILVIAVLNFLYAKKWGIVSMTCGSLGIAAGLAVFFFAINFAPGLASEKVEGFEIVIPWSILLTISAVLGVVSFFIVWAISRPILKFLFKETSVFHKLGRGYVGGVLSIFPTLVLAVLVLLATRIVGTAMELSYVHNITAPEVVELDPLDYPKPSRFISWRNDIERLPKLTQWLDSCDPFSRVENRNFGIVTIFAANDAAKEFSQSSSQMASILSNGKVKDWLESEEVADMLNLKNDRVALVLGEEAMEIASHRDLRNRLRNIDVKEHVDGFSKYLQTLDIPTSPTAVDTSTSDPKLESTTTYRPRYRTPSLDPTNGSSRTPSLDPTSGGSSRAPSLDPTSGGSSRTPSLDPTSGGSRRTPSLDPTSGGSRRTPSLDPTSGGSSRTPSLDPTSGGSRTPSLDPTSGGSRRPSLDPTSGGRTPSLDPTSGTPSLDPTDF